MDVYGADIIDDLPVLRLYPLADPDDNNNVNSRNSLKTAGNVATATTKFRRAGSCRSARLSRSETPDRLVFPGQQRPKSAACILRELQTPTKGRQRNSIRQDPEIEEVKNLPDAPKKVSRDELEIIVSRLQRQTNSGRARTALTRRINQHKQESCGSVRIDYLAFEPHRFRGLRKVSKSEMDNIVLRLSSYQKDRKPADSERYQVGRENNEKLGVLNSYRWKGIRNC